ncbi:unnamed protein product [Kuraishia capsulata CBS 1993]|uniref:glucan endo-1,3-beta-D-glucosidase n=1 Tax=Kuraishia capsulata CBS 1993 TaxID=1382522 RepID=W6MS72_9ASCO|nr:uncharacterized protein KUCA_T00004038001 [Kuraishia capsulata CBS 1993]CDK28057.1 unnamed protein product [Kuraishia capsulata CBS 1993]
MRLQYLSTLLFASSALAKSSASKSSSSSKAESTWSSEYSVLEFENFGFAGTYQVVSSMKDATEDNYCACEVSDDRVSFSGTNAPLNEELSVHIRGPLSLHKFAYYVSENYERSDSSSSKDWSRLAYYDSSSQTAENVTFMGNVGTNKTCLGKALGYVDETGLTETSDSTILEKDNMVYSDEEYAIFSNISCEDSGLSNDCGVYRSGIPAFHGFYGTTKMFLFEFEAPDDTTTDENTTSYNMPAIWLLNAQIPRTAQYPINSSCSCWSSGCGEFDIFEVMNSTESSRFYSTIHDFQGIWDIGTGIPIQGYLERTPGSKMSGGVVFGSDGAATVFLSNSTSFNSSISVTDLDSWIKGTEKVDTLLTISAASSTTTTSSSSKGDSGHINPSWLSTVIAGCFLMFGM